MMYRVSNYIIESLATSQMCFMQSR